MSVFEILMLLCFGAAWPVSIIKSYKARKNSGKSVGFLIIIFIGYLSGIINKLVYDFDLVIYLYLINAVMVSIDIGLFYRNRKKR